MALLLMVCLLELVAINNEIIEMIIIFFICTKTIFQVHNEFALQCSYMEYPQDTVSC